MMVDYVREMTVKKSCKYGEYGSFEHLVLLLLLLISSLNSESELELATLLLFRLEA